MRINSCKKRWSLIMLCIVFAFMTSVLGFARMFTRKASAENTVNVIDYFSVNSQAEITTNVQVGNNTAGDSFFPYGLLIKSEKAYSGDIVPTFRGDSSIVFRFMHPTSTNFSSGTKTGGDGNGDFKFTITDLFDAGNYLVVHFMQGQTVRVEYPTESGMKYLPAVTFQPGFNNVSFNFNLLDLKWSGENNDELVISTTTATWSGSSPLVKFDGSKEELPKMTFPHGYKISFSSDYETGTDIAFKSILGKSLMDEAGYAWKENKDMTLSEESIAIPVDATEAITYNGMEVVDGGTVEIPQYKQLGTFSTAWKYGDMLFPQTSLSSSGTIDTATVGNEAEISVQNGAQTYTYTFKVVEAVAPTLLILGEQPTDGFVGRAVEIPVASSDVGIEVQTTVTVNEQNVPLSGNSFMPTQAGIHTVTYSATAYNFTVTKSFDVKIIVDAVAPVIAVDCKDDYVSLGGVVSLPSATATDNADGVKTVSVAVTYNGENVPLTANKFTASQLGEYKVTYTCVDNAGNKAEIIYTVTSINPDDFVTLAMEKLIEVEDAVVTSQATSNDFTGLGISSTTAYVGSFNAIFEGNKALIFKFPGSTTDNSGRGNGYGDFYFKIADANNPDDYFTVRYGGGATMGVYVTYKGEKRYRSADGSPKAGTSLDSADEWSRNHTTPDRMIGFSSDKASHYNKLGLVWEDGVLSVVYNVERWLPAEEYATAKFDGTNKVTSTTWGLPKLDWKAYTISFGSNYEGGTDKGSDVIFLGVNGETDYFAEASLTKPIANTFLHNEKIVSPDDTLFVVKADGFGSLYSRFGADGAIFKAKKLSATTAIPTDYGTYTISYTVGGKTNNFTLRIADEFNFPVVKFHNEISSMTVVAQNSTSNVSATDIIATDDTCGIMESSAVDIMIKSPSNGSFVPYTTGYVFDELGEYVVRYSVKDTSKNESYIDRTIKVIATVAPVITVSGNIPSTAYVGESITLPTATADGLTVTMTVGYAGEVLTMGADGVLRFEEEGEYVVVYTATNEVGATGVREYVITVVKDSEAPVIAVDFVNKQVLKGTVITLATATATDNVDGDVKVTLVVTYGTQVIEVTDGKFTAEKLGAYTITYSCTDEAGCFTEKSFIVQSVNTIVEIEENGKENDDETVPPQLSGCSGCSGSVATGAWGLLFVATFAWVLKRGKKEN